MKKLCITLITIFLSYDVDNAATNKLDERHTASNYCEVSECLNDSLGFINSLRVPLFNMDTLSYILGYRESSNNYKAVHRITRCMGKYQFTHSTLRTLKIKTTTKAFLADSLLQEEAFKKLVWYEYEFLKRNRVLEYVGTKSVHGVPITVEGLIMASHLCGPVSVYDYIVNKNTHNRVINWGGQRVRVYKYDLNGTKIQNYLRYGS